MNFYSPLGETDFATLRRTGRTYVDKSSLITELIADGAKVVLLPRPRRFGKTTNLSMLRYFFERPPQPEDRSDLFQDLAVWSSAEARAQFQRFPVIFLTLKEVKPLNWQKCRADLAGLLSESYQCHRWLLEHPDVSADDQAQLLAILEQRADQTTLERSIRTLSRMLNHATGQPVLVLIDEYDTPIHAGWLHGYYQEIIQFFRVFLGAGLKDNQHLHRGVLTGILRVAKESIFSDINHMAVYSLLRSEYATAFGFTEDEVRTLAERAGALDHLAVLRRWYNGYSFGGATIYNPWSVLSFLASADRMPRSYWVNTSSNDLIHSLLASGRDKLSANLETLLGGGRILKRIEEGLVLPDLEQRDEAIWSLLLFSGYLKPTRMPRPSAPVSLAIPNREVAELFDSIFERWMDRGLGGADSSAALLTAMLRGEIEEVEGRLTDLLQFALSVHDVAGPQPERVYHAFILGLLVRLRPTHRVESNPESGYGRADVLVMPRKRGGEGMVLEFKRIREGEAPERALDAALAQIVARGYAAKVAEAGAGVVRMYGIVFAGKKAYVRLA